MTSVIASIESRRSAKRSVRGHRRPCRYVKEPSSLLYGPRARLVLGSSRTPSVQSHVTIATSHSL